MVTRAGPSAIAAGVVSAAVGLGIAELAAGLLPDGRSPVASTGDLVIRNSPTSGERWAIDTFGTNDKAFLVVVIVLVILALGGVMGVVYRRRRRLALGVVFGVAALGAFAALRRTDSTLLDLFPAMIGAGATLLCLDWLSRLDTGEPVGPLRPDAMGRRAFVFTGIAAAAFAPVAAAAGQKLQRRVDAEASRASVSLPRPANPLPPVSDGAGLGIDGLTPYVTPNRDFYRIDTALLVPQVTAESWTLRVHGRVRNELTITYDELLRRPLVEADITLCCVSNEVGGDLIGNARWLGFPLADLLAEAGVDRRADQIVGRAVDGFTVGFPTTSALDGRDALVAIGMNGEPLPVRHGFPARLVVAGLYGYVSATKWLKEIQLTTFDDFDAYWIERAWGLPAPIKVQSRIDVPHGNVRAGEKTAIAGVAWAQGRGIERVEVGVDGQWHDAELAAAVGDDTWRQWHLPWTFTKAGTVCRSGPLPATGRYRPTNRPRRSRLEPPAGTRSVSPPSERS